MVEIKHCPRCGSELVTDAPAGLCPKCLLSPAAVADPAALAFSVTMDSNIQPNDPATSRQHRPAMEEVGTRIGPYKLLQQIGEGGMGIVYMAEQLEPVRRKVALKVIKPGMDSAQIIARFEAERQALAMMDHPSIARVFDAGTTTNGRPYFVMELVQGIPITEYCDKKKLTPQQRLELFIPVCQAIQHAHQKGIIHRDLKPSNVMVMTYDGKPVPKVIDFGLAKALHQRLTEKTLFTQFGGMVGTPQYMSPEQTELDVLGTDTRSDVYSLGVMLYELLTGTTPLDVEKLRETSYVEMLRTIREEEPLRPSSRLNNSGEALVSISALRSIEPGKLKRLVHGDLDWIVMKALEKDRSRRYETADGLACDIDRYLQDEPVEASPPTTAYRLRKFARKNRGPLRVAAAFALLLVVATVFSAWQAIEATHARHVADAARGVAEEDRGKAEDERRKAVAAEQRTAQERDKVAAEKGRADDARIEAVAASARADAEAAKWKRQLSDHYVDRGIAAWAAEKPAVAALWFVQALRLDEGDPQRDAIQRMRIGVSLDRCPRPLDVPAPEVRGDSINSGKRLEISVKQVVVVDIATGQAVAPPMVHAGEVRKAAFSPDGKYVVTASFDNTARVWDAGTGQPVTPPMEHRSDVTCSSFSPDGRYIVTASVDKTARVWDAATGQPVSPPMVHEYAVYHAVFSPDGKHIVTCADGTARVWDATSGRPGTPPMEHSGEVTCAAFSPNGRYVVTASMDGSVRVWDAGSGRPVAPQMKHGSTVVDAAFSADGKYIVAHALFGPGPKSQSADPAWVWDAGTLNQFLRPMEQRGEVLHAGLSPDGKYVVIAGRSGGLLGLFEKGTLSSQGTARVWDVATGQPVAPAMAHRLPVNYAEFSPDGKYVVTASMDGTARVWDAATGKPLAAPLEHRGQVQHATFSPDGKFVVTASQDNTARVWDAGSGQPVAPPIEAGSAVNFAAFSPDGKYIVTVSANMTARVWDAGSGKAVTPPMSHRGPVLKAAFSADGKYVVTASMDGTARVWDSSSGQPVMPPIVGDVSQAQFSPNGRCILTVSGAIARVWDAGSGQPVTPPMEHGNEVHHAVFSADGKYVVTASRDRTARVWDAGSGKAVTPPLEHGDAVRQAAFSPDGKFIVTLAGSGLSPWTARTWAVGPTTLTANQAEQVAQLLSWNRVDATGGLVAVTQAEWTKLWNALRKEIPDFFAPRP